MEFFKEMDAAKSLVVTLFSMGIVFVSLLTISFLIDIMRMLVEKGSKKDVKQEQAHTVVKSAVQEPVQVPEIIEDDTELVAVITAAIAAMTGNSASGLVIRNIKRMPETDTTWAKTGKIELMR